jgi:tetratricopeptide (TPR) repeat protein
MRLRTFVAVLALSGLLGGAAAAQEPSAEAVGHNNRGAALLSQGKAAEAVAAFQRAVQIAPEYAVAQANLAFAYERQGQLDAAIGAYRRVLELDPGNVTARNNLGALYGKRGLWDDAAREFSDVLRRDPGNATATSNLRVLEHNRRVTDDKRARVEGVVKIAEARPADPRAAYDVARVHAQLGDHDNALAWLGKALELGYERREFARVDPSFATLRKDPRFQALFEAPAPR